MTGDLFPVTGEEEHESTAAWWKEVIVPDRIGKDTFPEICQRVEAGNAKDCRKCDESNR